ncbi:acyltransferase [Campylobacter sp. MIT 12-5580]|uniref:acyltransferase n=1 Tax=Campylobacter sp. MIT 12-5580 TaxID=2040651 RepID=UPI00201707F5|nr:acyltransferase [Campylobacter sp. MIT 12-5580]
MNINSMFFSREELEAMNFKSLGENVLIDRLTPIYRPEKISIGSNVRIGSFCILSGDIKIGDYVHIASYCFLNASNLGIEIGNFVNIGSYSRLLCESDDYSGQSLVSADVPAHLKNTQRGSIVLKNHCLVGSGVLILPRVVLEQGTSVGAMSMMKVSTEPFGIYAGIPAKKIKQRSKNLLKFEKEFLHTLAIAEV